jgi:CubicO group peptidase (beta-lactamase class C family)
MALQGRKRAWSGLRSGLYPPGVLPWAEAIDSLAEQSGFAGVISVDRAGEVQFARAYGLAHRAWQVPNTVGTRFAVASGTKGLTALTVVSLISDGALRLSTAARSVLGEDLPLIGEQVTVEHLLAHRTADGPRTNVFHLPVVGSGDGGIYSTAADISALWRSLFANQIVPAAWVAQMVRPRSDIPAECRRYGLGFWLGWHDSTGRPTAASRSAAACSLARRSVRCAGYRS